MIQNSPKFSVGQQIRKISSRDVTGIVKKYNGIRQGTHWYKIDFNGRILACPEHDLEAYSGELDVETEFKQGNFGSKKSFSKLLTYVKLTTPLRNNIYALYASKTEFHAYQYKPLLKFLDSSDQRLLIADEVGLGKTIESGLILIEQRARNPLLLKRVLIICPSSLTKKWRDEMLIRFQEKFEILDSRRLNEFFEDYQQLGDRATLKGIVSLQGIRSRKMLKKIDEINPIFDLIIIDEAHHLRNPKTLSSRVGKNLSTLTDGMILLSATPIHLGSQDLFNLLKILRPEEFENLFIFQKSLEANEFILKAERLIMQNTPDIPGTLSELKNLEVTYIRDRFIENPIYKDVIYRLENGKLTDRRAIIELQRDINSLNVTSHILTRTRKREVQTISLRTANTIIHDFCVEEMRFYRAVTEYVRSKYGTEGGPGFAVFVAMIYQRQVASCIPAMVESYRQKFNIQEQVYSDVFEGIDFDIEDWLEEDIGYNDTESQDDIKELIRSCQVAKGIDSKYDALIKQLRLLEEEESGRKIILFSYFRKTLEYLSKKLENDGFINLVMHGGYKPFDRYDIMRRFRKDSKIQILLSSEVGSEGLDFEFCHIMINYDLPWNPMKVEQRIGRIDRFGQQSDRIIVINLVTRDTIEEKIVQRLYDRIGIFENSIGDLEPILGEQILSLSRELLSSHLTESEEEERIEQAANALENERQQLEKLEKESSKLIGFDEYFRQEFDRIRKNNNYISGDELHTYTEEFLTIAHPEIKLKPLDKGIGKIYELKINEKFLQRLRDCVPSDNEELGEIVNAYYHNDKTLLITFDSETANKEKELIFININHPLVRTIKKYYDQHKEQRHPVSRIELKSNKFTSGYYFYFIYMVEFTGAREEKRLENIVLKATELTFLNNEEADRLVGEAKIFGAELSYVDTFVSEKVDDAFDQAADHIIKYSEERKAELIRINETLIVERIASLKKSYDLKIIKAEKMLEIAEDERIIRMYQGQIRNLRDQKQEKIRKIEDNRNVETSIEEIAAGVIKIV